MKGQAKGEGQKRKGERQKVKGEDFQPSAICHLHAPEVRS
jgi:hypothetical protein